MVNISEEKARQTYKSLAVQLESKYPNLNFRNHCYWRIALDNTFGDRWDRKIERPAIRHLTLNQLNFVNSLLSEYLRNEELLLKHNQNSLFYRNKRIKKTMHTVEFG